MRIVDIRPYLEDKESYIQDATSKLLARKELERYYESYFWLYLKRPSRKKYLTREKTVPLEDHLLHVKSVIEELGGEVEEIENRLRVSYRQTNLKIVPYRETKKRLTKEEQIELAKLAQKGDLKARDALVEYNHNFVVRIAKRYRGHISKVQIEDLIQEGKIGLMKGIEKFNSEKINPDTNKPYSLLTYVAWWIRSSITRSIIDTSKLVRLTSNAYYSDRKIIDIQDRYMLEENRNPTEEEISEETGFTLPQVKIMNGYKDEYVWLGENPDEVIEKIIQAEPRLEDRFSTEEKKDHVNYSNLYKEISRLDPRLEKILIKNFGLNGEKRITLGEIGIEESVSRERIRQLKVRAFKKLETIESVKALSHHPQPIKEINRKSHAGHLIYQARQRKKAHVKLLMSQVKESLSKNPSLLPLISS